MSLHFEPSKTAKRKARLQRRLGALFSVILSVTILAGALATLGLLATQPIPEYCPQFILRVDEVETTCGGSGCGGLGLRPNYDLPRPIRSNDGLLFIPDAPRWENTDEDLEIEPLNLGDASDLGEYW